MMTARLVLTFVLFAVFAIPAAPASVSSSRQSCIRNAMTAGSSALGNPARLNLLYERYFAGEKIAQLAAGRDWQRYNKAQKDAQRNRVRRFVVQVLAPSFAGYKGSRIKFLSESGSKVRGVITASGGERRTVTWHFVGSCKFINVSIEGFGSLVTLIGKEQTRP